MGLKTEPWVLVKASIVYENSTLRRLGYLRDLTDLARQARALEPWAKYARQRVGVTSATR